MKSPFFGPLLGGIIPSIDDIVNAFEIFIGGIMYLVLFSMGSLVWLVNHILLALGYIIMSLNLWIAANVFVPIIDTSSGALGRAFGGVAILALLILGLCYMTAFFLRLNIVEPRNAFVWFLFGLFFFSNGSAMYTGLNSLRTTISSFFYQSVVEGITCTSNPGTGPSGGCAGSPSAFLSGVKDPGSFKMIPLCDNFSAYVVGSGLAPTYTYQISGLDMAVAFMRADPIDILGYFPTGADTGDCNLIGQHQAFSSANPNLPQWATAMPWSWGENFENGPSLGSNFDTGVSDYSSAYLAGAGASCASAGGNVYKGGYFNVIKAPGLGQYNNWFLGNTCDGQPLPNDKARGMRNETINAALAGVTRAFYGIPLSIFSVLEQLTYLCLTIAQGLAFIGFFIAIFFALFKKTEPIAWAVIEQWIGLIVMSTALSVISALVVGFYELSAISGAAIIAVGLGIFSLIMGIVILASGVKAITSCAGAVFNAMSKATGGMMFTGGDMMKVGTAMATGGASLMAVAGNDDMSFGEKAATVAGSTFAGNQALTGAARVIGRLPNADDTGWGSLANTYAASASFAQIGDAMGGPLGGMLMAGVAQPQFAQEQRDAKEQKVQEDEQRRYGSVRGDDKSDAYANKRTKSWSVEPDQDENSAKNYYANAPEGSAEARGRVVPPTPKAIFVPDPVDEARSFSETAIAVGSIAGTLAGGLTGPIGAATGGLIGGGVGAFVGGAADFVAGRVGGNASDTDLDEAINANASGKGKDDADEQDDVRQGVRGALAEAGNSSGNGTTGNDAANTALNTAAQRIGSASDSAAQNLSRAATELSTTAKMNDVQGQVGNFSYGFEPGAKGDPSGGTSHAAIMMGNVLNNLQKDGTVDKDGRFAIPDVKEAIFKTAGVGMVDDGKEKVQGGVSTWGLAVNEANRTGLDGNQFQRVFEETHSSPTRKMNGETRDELIAQAAANPNVGAAGAEQAITALETKIAALPNALTLHGATGTSGQIADRPSSSSGGGYSDPSPRPSPLSGSMSASPSEQPATMATVSQGAREMGVNRDTFKQAAIETANTGSMSDEVRIQLVQQVQTSGRSAEAANNYIPNLQQQLSQAVQGAREPRTAGSAESNTKDDSEASRLGDRGIGPPANRLLPNGAEVNAGYATVAGVGAVGVVMGDALRAMDNAMPGGRITREDADRYLVQAAGLDPNLSGNTTGNTLPTVLMAARTLGVDGDQLTAITSEYERTGGIPTEVRAALIEQAQTRHPSWSPETTNERVDWLVNAAVTTDRMRVKVDENQPLVSASATAMGTREQTVNGLVSSAVANVPSVNSGSDLDSLIDAAWGSPVPVPTHDASTDKMGATAVHSSAETSVRSTSERSTSSDQSDRWNSVIDAAWDAPAQGATLATKADRSDTTGVAASTSRVGKPSAIGASETRADLKQVPNGDLNSVIDAAWDGFAGQELRNIPANDGRLSTGRPTATIATSQAESSDDQDRVSQRAARDSQNDDLDELIRGMANASVIVTSTQTPGVNQPIAATNGNQKPAAKKTASVEQNEQLSASTATSSELADASSAAPDESAMRAEASMTGMNGAMSAAHTEASATRPEQSAPAEPVNPRLSSTSASMKAADDLEPPPSGEPNDDLWTDPGTGPDFDELLDE